jgi:hypothetical protein
MTYEDILQDLAPCGLSCRKCFAYSEGDIARHSRALKDGLGNFDVYAERFSAFLPEFKDYQAFRDLLAYLANADCRGCRNGACKWPDCGVAACDSGKGVDFCFQCDEFPCDKTNFDPHLRKRWINMQNRMKAIGVEAFYGETRNKPRYV